MANGAVKYGPYNWRESQISATVYYAACSRHLKDWYDRIDKDDSAPDSGVHHLKHAAACLAMLLDTLDSDMLNDNRPPKIWRTKTQPATGKTQKHGGSPTPKDTGKRNVKPTKQTGRRG